MMYAFSFSPWSIQPVICVQGSPRSTLHRRRDMTLWQMRLTTLVSGYFEQKFFRPSGDAIYGRTSATFVVHILAGEQAALPSSSPFIA